MTDDREEELRRLMQEHGTPLLRLCTMWLQDEHLAQDAVQETFIKAWKHLDTFRGESTEKTWLTRIAINTCKDMKRSRWLKNPACGESVLANLPADDFSHDDSVIRAVSLLPIKERQVVLLHYYEGLTILETARMLHVSQAAVNSRLSRARGHLRNTLKEWYFDDE